MKKIINYICCILVFAILFTIPVWGYPSQEKWDEFYSVVKEWDIKADYLGSISYWQDHYPKDTPLPEPLLGDSNIDGKVDAVDALFALNFAVHGNWLTCRTFGGSKKSNVSLWRKAFDEEWNNGTIRELEQSADYKESYCMYNSCFFADVTKDYMVNAADALEILKYAVGKEVNFSTNDFTYVDYNFAPYPWVDEYTPEFYNQLDAVAK